MMENTGLFLGRRSLERITVVEDASELMVYAAGELQKYLRRALGCALKIVRGVPQEGDIVLSLAKMEGESKLFDRTRVVDRGGYLELKGENPVSVLYAVYDFLKEYLGVRFYAAGERFESVPKQEAVHLSEGVKREFGSAFEIRDFVNRTNSPDVLSFAVKNRINTILGCGPWVNGSENCSYENARLIHAYGLKVRGPGHSWKHFVPDESLFASHPEYFPCFNGQRRPNGRTACFSNPEVRRIFRDKLRCYLREHPYWDVFAFWAEDLPDMHYCQCPECSKMSTTDWYLTLANEAAEVVSEELPEARFELIVYQGTNQPPQSVRKLFRDGENMLVNFCFGQTRDLFTPFAEKHHTNAALFDIYQTWRNYLADVGYRGKTMLMEYYNLCEYPNAGPCGRALMWPLELMQTDIKFYFRDGLDGLGAFTGFDRLAFPSPWRHWAWINLWTNPDADLEQLKGEFYQRYYGEQAGNMRDYFQRLETLMFNEVSDANIAGLEALGSMLDGLREDKFEVVKAHLQLSLLVKRLHWAFKRDERGEFEKLKAEYKTFQGRHVELLAKMTAPFPMLWFDFIFYRIDWLPDGMKRQFRPGTEPTLR